MNNSDCVPIISFWIYCYISQWHLMHFPFTWYFWRGVRSQLGMVCRNLFNDIFVLGFLLLSSNFQNFLPGFRVHFIGRGRYSRPFPFPCFSGCLLPSGLDPWWDPSCTSSTKLHEQLHLKRRSTDCKKSYNVCRLYIKCF